MNQLKNYTYHHGRGVDTGTHAYGYFAMYQMIALLNAPYQPTTLDPTKGLRYILEEYTLCCNWKKCSNDKCM